MNHLVGGFSVKLSVSGGMLVFLGAFFWSLNAPLVKFLNMDAFLLCGLRSAIAAVVMAGFIRPKRLNWNGWMVLYLLSYCGLCLTIILSLKLTAAPIAVGMQYTATAWLFLVRCLKQRRFDSRGFLPICVILLGMVLFMCSGTDSGSRLGNLIALSTGVIFACLTVSAKKAAGTNVLGLTALGNFFTAFAMLLLFPSSLSGIPAMTGSDWAIMLLLGTVQVGCGYAFYNMGVQKVSPQKASVLSLWEMILGPLWVAIFLREYPSLLVIFGFLVILFGMLLDAKMSTETENSPV